MVCRRVCRKKLVSVRLSVCPAHFVTKSWSTYIHPGRLKLAQTRFLMKVRRSVTFEDISKFSKKMTFFRFFLPKLLFLMEYKNQTKVSFFEKIKCLQMLRNDALS